MDDELGRLYKAALASASEKEALKTEQKAWLASRDQCQDSNCIMKAYADRIAALKRCGQFSRDRHLHDEGRRGASPTDE